jgi:hypothetical protein
VPVEESITRARIDELLQFLPRFEAPDRAFIQRWAGGKEGPDGPMTMPYPVYAEDVQAFFRLAGQPWWSDYDYHPARAREMLEDDAFVARATLAEVKTMLTYCVRGERFGDGFWAAMLEQGRVVALLRRLAVLRDTVVT